MIRLTEIGPNARTRKHDPVLIDEKIIVSAQQRRERRSGKDTIVTMIRTNHVTGTIRMDGDSHVTTLTIFVAESIDEIAALIEAAR